MIIKFCVDKRWQMFDEVDSLSFRVLDDNIAGEIVASKECLDFTGFPYDEDTAKEKNVEIWFMNKNQLEETQIICRCPVYLLNNAGKTIETIR